MLNFQVGDMALRITPPEGSRPGFCQAGRVTTMGEKIIEVTILADVPRVMRFFRSNGLDNQGMGSFLVKPDSL